MENQDIKRNPDKGKWGEGFAELVRIIAHYTAGDDKHAQVDTAIPGLTLFRHDEATPPQQGTYAPSICLVAQGTKMAQLGDEEYAYDIHNYLITSIHLPATFRVVEASSAKPYLSLLLKIDMRELAQLLVDSNLSPLSTRQSPRGMAVGEVTLPLLAAFQRLVGLLATPEDINVLSPIYQREIIYRLLTGSEGHRLRQIASAGTQSNQIAKAIDWLQKNYDRPLRVNELASRSNMSPSSFHSRFRLMTSLSPLQYQKHLRLQEARRLMLVEQLDATRAAFQVGYESSSQFNREYSRLFGDPPLRDVARLRNAVP